MSASSSQPESDRSGGVRRRRHIGYALVLSGVLVLSQFGMNLLPIFRDRLQRYLGIGDGEYGLLLSLGPLIGVAGVFAGGALTVRMGPVRVMRYGLIGMASAMLLIASAGPRWILVLAGNMLAALAIGPLGVAGNAFLTRLFPGERRRVLALSLVVAGAGGMVIPLAGEGLMALTGPGRALGFGPVFRGLYVVLALLLAAATFLYRSRITVPRRASGGQPLWSGFLLPLPVAWLVVMSALHAGVDSALFNWMPRFLGSASFPAVWVMPGVVMSGAAFAYLVSRSLLMLLPDDRGRRSLLILPGLLGGGCLVAAILARDYRWVPVGYVLGAFLWSVEYPAMLGALADMDRRRFATALALSQMLSGLATFGFTYGIGLATDRIGDARMWQPMTLGACVFPVIGVMGAIWVWRLRGRLKLASPAN